MSNVQSLCLRCELGPEGTARLIATQAGKGSFFPDFKKETPLEDLFTQDLLLVDHWLEFVIKMSHDPGRKEYDQKDGDTVSKFFLFYLACSQQWAYIRFSYNLKTQQANVDFSAPPEKVTFGAVHLQSMRQDLRLQSTVVSGGDWEMDLRAKEIFLSRKMAQILKLGQGPMVMKLKAFYGLVHPDDLPALKKAIRNIKKKQKNIFLRAILPEGQTVYFKSFALPLFDEKGRVVKVKGHSQNITEKEEAQEKLAVSEQRFRGIVENSQDLFITLDSQSRINYISPNVQEIAGYSSQEVRGRKFLSFFVDAREQSAALDQYIDVLSGGVCTMGEYRIRTKEGETIWLSMKASPILDSAGRVVEVVTICRDITEKKRHQTELEYISTHDSLTGAFNRFSFERELTRIDREGVENYGLILTDVNGLKLINDAFGHEKGDAMLKRAWLMLSELGGRVYRVGGDEFAIILYRCTAGLLDEYCEKIDAACQRTQSKAIPMSISWGAVLADRSEYSAQAVYRQAEGRMYNNKLLESRSLHSQVISSLKEALRARNLETSDHTNRMESMVMALGKKLELPSSDFDKLVLLASMHDIGKVAIPDSIINKPASLTDEEWEIMRTHSEVGSRIARTSSELSVIADEICCHHERWDGSGYPYGYRQEEIPLLSRIISVVDTYDVMTNGRVYRPAVDHQAAIDELHRCSGSQFDPKIVGLFTDIFGQIQEQDMQRYLGGGRSVSKLINLQRNI